MFKKSVDLDEDILRKNRIAILIHDEEWIKLFGDSKDRNIREAKEELSQLITRNKIIESCDKKLHKEKSKYMRMILNVSESVNSEVNENKKADVKLLDKYKKKIININDEIDDIKFQLEVLPKEIREANFKLLTATVEYGYNELKNKEKDLIKAVEEIETLRLRLKELFKIKHDNEEWINETYVFLHGVLGSEVIEEIDRSKFRKR